MKKFNDKFIFSTSSCAFQIEGGRFIGGRTRSIWDDFTIMNFYIPKNGKAEREINSIKDSADFYHRYKEDIKIMKNMGVNAFIYNMDWARIFPNNKNKVNHEGINWYIKMFKELHDNGIKPIPILYHWDHPSWLEKLGGVDSHFFLDAFREFSKVLYKNLGKYTDIWYVSDENSTFTTSAYLSDYNPPQINNSKRFWFALHNLNLSAAIAMEEFKKAKKKGYINKKAILGIDHDWSPGIPYDKNNQEDIKATKIFNKYNLDLFLDPNMKGTYPDIFYDEIKKLKIDVIKDGDMNLLKNNRLDFIGWNYYRPSFIASPKRVNKSIKWFKKPEHFITKKALIVYPDFEKYTSWGWLIKPETLVPSAKILYKKYNKPLMIVENGIGFFDKKQSKTVNDHYRIKFLNDHLKMVQKSTSKGIPFIGYSVWTYCDIFSPSGGYRKKYGLVGIDFENKTLDRFPKASYFWYKEVIKNKSACDSPNYKEYFEKAIEYNKK